MNNQISDAYIIYKLQCKTNILEAYFPFIANIIAENSRDEIDENSIKQGFEKKYGISISIPFIRQVLGVGADKK